MTDTDTEHQADEGPERAEEDGETAGDERGRGADEPAAMTAERLESLQEDIDAVRRRVEDGTVDEGGERFIQEGEASEDEPVDDTIAPPG